MNASFPYSSSPPILDLIYQSYQDGSLSEAFKEACTQASKLFEGVGIAAQATQLALSDAHPLSPLGGRVATFTDQVRHFITALQLPSNSLSMVEAAIILSDQCAQSEDAFGWLDRINGIRDLVFDNICSLIGDACDSMTLVVDYLSDVPPEALRVIEAIAGITLTFFALNELSHLMAQLVEWESHPTDPYTHLGLLVAKMLKNLFLLTLGALTITTVLGGITLASPWIVFAIVTAHFVVSCGIFFAEKVLDASSASKHLMI